MKFLKQIKQYPTAIVGLIMISIIMLIAVYAVVSIPYERAVVLWRGNEEDTYRNPQKVPPAWVNIFRKNKLPESFSVYLSDGANSKVQVEDNSTDGLINKTYTYKFDFNYGEYFQEISLYAQNKYNEKKPYIEAFLITPDGREIRIVNGGMSTKYVFRLSQDSRLKRSYNNAPIKGLFSTLESIENNNNFEVLNGEYTLVANVRGFEEDTTIALELVVHGKVYGLAGTDHLRRDISIALLWGAPIGLTFGLIAALGISILTMIISAMGTWFGGFIDSLIQRMTEVNMMLPFLPILIMIGTFYSKSIWTILGVTILLSIFSTSIKTYRATFMQIKQSTYIEAAKVYGASNTRIILKYMLPKILPMLIPGLVLSIPSYVFLEASLAVLGLGDPTLPTWGKLIHDAHTYGALWNAQYYWILEPAMLLVITGFSFAMLGFALDKIFNPRLREQ